MEKKKVNKKRKWKKKNVRGGKRTGYNGRKEKEEMKKKERKRELTCKNIDKRI